MPTALRSLFLVLGLVGGCAALDEGPRPDMVLGDFGPDLAFVTGAAPSTDDVRERIDRGWTPDYEEHCLGLTDPLMTLDEASLYARAFERFLASRGADVALVFHQSAVTRRVMPKHLRYGHGAILLRAPDDELGRPRYVSQNLMPGHGPGLPCDRTTLVAWPIDDFVKELVELDSAVIVPTPEVAARIRRIVESDTYSAMHNPEFSIVANPLEDRYQNCAGLILHVVIAAGWNTTDHAEVDRILRARFRPSMVRTFWPMRVFGPLVSSRLRSADQDWVVSTAGYESIAAFMLDNGLAAESTVFYFDPRPGPGRNADHPNLRNSAR